MIRHAAYIRAIRVSREHARPATAPILTKPAMQKYEARIIMVEQKMVKPVLNAVHIRVVADPYYLSQ